MNLLSKKSTSREMQKHIKWQLLGTNNLMTGLKKFRITVTKMKETLFMLIGMNQTIRFITTVQNQKKYMILFRN